MKLQMRRLDPMVLEEQNAQRIDNTASRFTFHINILLKVQTNRSFGMKL